MLAGCAGGSTGTSTGVDCGLADAAVICLDSCNLGCSSTGCSQTDIAQNQIILFNFSEDVDPATVSSSSIRFRTAAGDEPVGEFFVDGRTVRFQPTLSVSGGQTFYGFTSGETYTLTILGGGTQTSVVRSTSGKPFAATLTCTLRSSLGIVDLNGVAPAGQMVVPTPSQNSSAPRDTDIVIEFNELIDATPFLSGTQSPVTFSVRRNREVTPGSGVYECNPNSTPQTIGGTQVLDFDAARGISILSFRPSQPLPGNICVEVNVTDGVADLSGRPAQPQTFTFRTVVVPLVETNITETFANDDQLDDDASAASWSGGVATFYRIGGDGRHGEFSVEDMCTNTLTTIEGKRVFTLNTDLTIIPARFTTTGVATAVTDGRFFFTKMVVPSDVRLKVIGTRPPQITVAGRLDVLGDIDVAGAGNTTVPLSSTTAGQPGGQGGPGGGSGGKGGDKITATQATTTGATAANQGVNGQDARVLAGQGYATSVAGTGGRGSTVFPASGLNSAIFYGATTGVPYSPMAAAAGGGGGYELPGAAGVVVSNNHPEPGLLGVATSAIVAPTATTITAAAAGTGNPLFPWYPNRYAGRTLNITAGTGIGQSRTIVSNGGANNATFTVGAAWDTLPDATSVFTVVGGPAPLPFCIGPSTTASAALTLFPFPPATGLQLASQHFLVGGSGGGGGASHACLSLGIGGTDRWAPGAGGGGGGGAISLRAGRSLGQAPAARIFANGGSAANSTGTASGAQACVAGGGSGGSVVLQSGNVVGLGGLIDVRGGTGGTFNRTAGVSAGAPPQGAAVQLRGGDGAAGYVRLETPTLSALTVLAGVQPAATNANLGVLSERDPLVVCGSRYYSTGQVFGPEFARYEIRGTIDGTTPFVYSDDPAVSTIPALEGAAIRVLFQAAQLDLATGAVQGEPGPWRQAVRSSGAITGIDADGFNGFRFKLYADYTLGTTITVDEVVVVYRI